MTSIGQVELTAGATTTLDFDATDVTPIVATVHVQRGGRTEPGLLVAAHPSAEPLAVHALTAPRASTDPEGNAYLLLVGDGPWRFCVSDAANGSNGWSHAVAGDHVADAERTIAVSTNFTTSDGRLVVVDANGAPVARTPLVVFDSNGVANWCETDEQGQIAATMAVGRYEFGVVSRAEHIDGRPVIEVASRSAVEWTAQGPEPARIKVLLTPP